MDKKMDDKKMEYKNNLIGLKKHSKLQSMFLPKNI